MYSIEEVFSFIEKQTGCSRKEINDESDIAEDLGASGDDWDEMMCAYSKQFNVDLTNYLWYFHSDEEGGWNSIGGWFFRPPYLRVKRISVTPIMLQRFANEGKWNFLYPEHKLPKRRYDILINTILVLSLAIYFLYRLIKWLI